MLHKLPTFDILITPDKLQSKSLLTIDERGSKIARNDILSTLVDSINVYDCRLSGV